MHQKSAFKERECFNKYSFIKKGSIVLFMKALEKVVTINLKSKMAYTHVGREGRVRPLPTNETSDVI